MCRACSNSARRFVRAPARALAVHVVAVQLQAARLPCGALHQHIARGNPVQWSFDVVAGASSPRTRHIRWDYRQEDPVNDMRGMRLDRASARADMLTDEPQPHVTNVIAPNGGRIYVDHAHPE